MTLPCPSGPDVDALVERISDAAATLNGNSDIRFGGESDRAFDDLRDALGSLAALARSAADTNDLLRDAGEADVLEGESDELYVYLRERH